MTFPISIPADAEVLGARYCVAVDLDVDPVPLIGVNSRRDTSRPIYLNITAARQEYVVQRLISAVGKP